MAEKKISITDLESLLNIFPGESMEVIFKLHAIGLTMNKYKRLQMKFPESTSESYLNFFTVQNKSLLQFMISLGDAYSMTNFHYAHVMYDHLGFAEILKTLSKEDSVELSKDPAMSTFIAMYKNQWLPEVSHEDKLIVARNMYFRKILATEYSVQDEYERLLLSRNEYNDIALFTGKNVVFAAHGESLAGQHGGGPRFGKDATIQAIRDQGGYVDDAQIHRNNSSYLEVMAARRKALESLENTPSPMTFIFEGHGSKTGIFFSDGELEGGGNVNKNANSVNITHVEFAEALLQRSALGNMTEDDIIIISSCYNQTFIRNVYDYMQSQSDQYPNMIFPIFIGKGEYEEVTYSDFDSDYGSIFNEHILDLSKPTVGGAESTSLGDIDKNYKDIGQIKDNTNPSVFIPKGSVIMQISNYNREGELLHQNTA